MWFIARVADHPGCLDLTEQKGESQLCFREKSGTYDEDQVYFFFLKAVIIHFFIHFTIL